MLSAIIITRFAMRCLAMYAAFPGHYCNSRLERKRIFDMKDFVQSLHCQLTGHAILLFLVLNAMLICPHIQ